MDLKDTMMSAVGKELSKGRRSSASTGHTSILLLHIVANLLRIWSVYSMYRYLSHQSAGPSVVVFIFTCLVPSALIFLVLHKPWKGRPLSNSQLVPSVLNGAITALYFVLWGKGLHSCGPVRAILGEYAGAILGVLSALLYGSRGRIWHKVCGLIAVFTSYYFLSQGWATATSSPFSFSDSPDDEVQKEQVLGMHKMLLPIFAGILSALKRVIARRISLKNQLKRRLNAISIASATCFLFPIAMWDMIVGSTDVELPFSVWAFSSFILFGIVLIFYVESLAEERLHMVFSSPRHLMVAGICIIVMEILYQMDFDLLGFLICSTILGFGIYEATSLDRGRKDSLQNTDLSNGIFEDQLQMSPLPT